jgi:hypothetical protein
MNVVSMLMVFLVNGIIEVGMFFARELFLLGLIVCALVFTRWEIAEYQETSSGIGPDEVVL